MLYLQLKGRACLRPGEQLLLRHVADALDTDGKSVLDLPVECPKTPGVWRLPAMAVVKALSPVCGEITVLGEQECYVHVQRESKHGPAHFLRTALAFLLLAVGSAMAITWFHADVNMAEAQQTLYRMVTGHPAADPLLITVPYAAGVFLGVALFYALIGKKHTVAPLDIKLEDYRKSAEKYSGLIP
ncbi:MAG: hypothetical protein J5472_03370 [Clostridia bacterium]|nr:hypothetical protein [Clostridia bacterium]